MQMAQQLGPQTDELVTECFLQLCDWHGAEAIKKRLTREGDPLETRQVLSGLIWRCIKLESLMEVERNHGLLLDQLRQNKFI